SDKDFDFEMYKSVFMNNAKSSLDSFDASMMVLVKSRFETLKKHIMEMKYTVLRQVMRNNDKGVVGLCNEMRACVLGEIIVPKFFKFKGNKVFLYKHNNSISRFQSEWFKKCLEYFESKDEKQQLSNIILTWTNRQTDEYNDKIRKIL